MSYKILTKKLYLTEEKIISRDLVRDYCKKLKLDYKIAIIYLLNNRYLYRILRGIFYKPSIEERKLKKIDIDYKEAIAAALKIKGIKNWYFGLETALKLNNYTHEYFTIDFIINDTIYRVKPLEIFGHKIKFSKLKKGLFKFGIKNHVSEIEKTVLDIIYLSKYGGFSDKEINNKIVDLIGYCSETKLLEYSENYNKNIVSFVEKLICKR